MDGLSIGGRRALRLVGKTAKTSLPDLELPDGGHEVVRREIRPRTVCEEEIGVARFPEEEVAETSLATGANQEVDVRRAGGGAGGGLDPDSRWRGGPSRTEEGPQCGIAVHLIRLARRDPDRGAVGGLWIRW